MSYGNISSLVVMLSILQGDLKREEKARRPAFIDIARTEEDTTNRRDAIAQQLLDCETQLEVLDDLVGGAEQEMFGATADLEAVTAILSVLTERHVTQAQYYVEIADLGFAPGVFPETISTHQFTDVCSHWDRAQRLSEADGDLIAYLYRNVRTGEMLYVAND